MFPAIHEHLSVQEWSELNKQATGNGASGPRPRLNTGPSGARRRDATRRRVVHECDAFPRRMLWHAIGGPLVRRVRAVHPPGHQVADVVFQNCAADHGDTISVPLR